MMYVGPQFELTSHLIEAVSSGIGVGLVPSFLVQDELRAGAVALAIDRPLTTGLSYFLFVPQHESPLPQVAVFKDWMNIPRQSEQGFHGKKNTNSTAK
jgi:DNA-binding transcriptional LysR family regulator